MDTRNESCPPPSAYARRPVEALARLVAAEGVVREVYDPDEAGVLLHMSRRSVDRAIRRGDIAAVKIGGLVRISRREIDRLLGSPDVRGRAFV